MTPTATGTKKAPAKRAASAKPAKTEAPDLQNVDLKRSQITVPADNARNNGHPDEALADSIADVGLLQPVIVATANGTSFELVGGFRRIAAIDHLIKTKRWPAARMIPARLATAEPGENTERLVAMLVENLLRRDLDPLEEAGGFFRLVELGMSKADLARRVNRSDGHVSGRLELLALVPELQKAVTTGALPIAKAGEWAKLPPDAQKKILKAAGKDLDFDRWQVNEAVRAAQQDLAAAALTAKWEAKGATVTTDREALIVSNESWHADSYHAKQYIYLGDKALDAHPNEPCAAVRVAANYGRVEIVHVCLDPKRHDEKGDSTLKRPTPTKRQSTTTEADKRAKARARAEQAHAREQLVAVLGGKLKQADALELLAEMTFTNGHSAAAKIACELLDIDVPSKRNTYGGTTRDWAGALHDYGASSAANRARAALVMAAAEALGFEWAGGFRKDHQLMPRLTELGWQSFDPKAAAAK